MIKLGSSDMSKAYVGSTEVSKVYLGSELVYQNTPPVPLPYDAEVEYLESTGTQYIDTGVTLNASNAKDFYFKFGISSLWTTEDIIILGSLSDTNHRTYVFLTNLNFVRVRWCDGTNRTLSASAVQLNEIVEFYCNGGNWTVKYTGQNKTMSYSGGASYSTKPLLLFGRYNVDEVQSSPCRFYSARIGSNIDLIPVRVGQVGYMYDKVSGTLYGNSGTGSFTLGPDVV